MRSPAYLALSAACLLAGPRSLAATEIPRHVAASGGGRAASAGHVVAGTAGQAVAGSAVSAHLVLSSGFWPGGSPSGVGIDEEPGTMPVAFLLHPNRPNPFGLRTVIRFDVPAGGGRVALRVYDFRGRLVRTLLDGMQTPGVKRAIWDGKDDRGGEAASGIYIVLLDAPGLRQARKATRVR